MTYRMVAEVIGRQLNLPATSLHLDEAEAHLGGLAMFVAGNGPASSAWTRKTLGWEPKEVGIVADIEQPDYSG